MPLTLAAKVDPADRVYFETTIEPLLDHPLIRFIGEVDEAGKRELLANALALVFPIDWPEPFGLVMIEAMSAGTPVIAWRNGSVPEVIEHGRSGLIVDDIAAAVDAVAAARGLDRAEVRAAFEERFTATRMANDYVAAYGELMARTPRSATVSRAPIKSRLPLLGMQVEAPGHALPSLIS